MSKPKHQKVDKQKLPMHINYICIYIYIYIDIDIDIDIDR